MILPIKRYRVELMHPLTNRSTTRFMLFQKLGTNYSSEFVTLQGLYQNYCLGTILLQPSQYLHNLYSSCIRGTTKLTEN
jgi:hypothetical protein